MKTELEKHKEDLAEEEVSIGFENPLYTREQIDSFKEYLKVMYKTGFDAAIALDLPVKFAKWYRYEFNLLSIPNQSDKAYQKAMKLQDRVREASGGWPTTEQLYKYWIENIYKPE